MNTDTNAIARRLSECLHGLVLTVSYSERRDGPRWHAMIAHGPSDQRLKHNGHGTSCQAAILDAVVATIEGDTWGAS